MDKKILAPASSPAVMALRKINLYTTTLQDNAVSWVNQTAEKLHVNRIYMNLILGPNAVLGDQAEASLDEVPTGQSDVNNSRSHILSVRAAVDGATGATESAQKSAVMYFKRGELVLDPDEALYLNTTDKDGAPPFACNVNIWYDD